MVTKTFTRDSSKDIILDTTKYISQLSDGTNTYVIKDAEARTSIANKQDTLVSGTNIKTINSASLLGSGNIDVLTNLATGEDSTSVNGYITQYEKSTSIGKSSGGYKESTSVGYNAMANGQRSVAIGCQASASGTNSIQLGKGSNSESSSLYVATSPSNNWKMLGSDGTIPNARLNVMTGADGTNAGTKGAVPAPTATDNTKFLRGDGTWATAGGSDVEVYTTSEIETIWDNVVPSSFSFIKGSGVTDYTINDQTYNSNESISLWDGEYILTISTNSISTGGLCINDTTLGLTLSCSVIVSGSSITFSNSIYTVSGTSSTNFTLTFSSGGSVN